MALPVRSWVGQGLGYQQQIDQARAALALAEQQRAAAGRAEQNADLSSEAYVGEAERAERELILMTAQIDAQRRIAIIEGQLAALQSAATAPQPSAQVTDFQTSAETAFGVIFTDLSTHDSGIIAMKEKSRQDRATFYRETLRKGHEVANTDKNISLGFAGGTAATGILAPIGLIILLFPGRIYENKRVRIAKALQDFNSLIDRGGDPRESYCVACKRHGVTEDDLNIKEDFKRGFWKHPT